MTLNGAKPRQRKRRMPAVILILIIVLSLAYYFDLFVKLTALVGWRASSANSTTTHPKWSRPARVPLPPRQSSGEPSLSEVQALPMGARITDLLEYFPTIDTTFGSNPWITYPAVEGGHYLLLCFDVDRGIRSGPPLLEYGVLTGVVHCPIDASAPCRFVSPPERSG